MTQKRRDSYQAAFRSTTVFRRTAPTARPTRRRRRPSSSRTRSTTPSPSCGSRAMSSGRRSSRCRRRSCRRTTTRSGTVSENRDRPYFSTCGIWGLSLFLITMQLDKTHDPELRSWVEYPVDTDFPIQNLPFGVFRRKGSKETPRGGVAIGDQIFDLAALGIDTGPNLNRLAASGRTALRELRKALSLLFSDPGKAKRFKKHLLPMKKAELFLPVAVGDYSDFFAGIHHATNMGRMFRPDNPLLPNYKWVPIGYHGRASSIVVSGTPLRRPQGQTKPADAGTPSFGPSRRLDYEAELGFVVGPGNSLGKSIAIKKALDHVFGVVLLNDWSARDIQAWEYQPL